MAAVIATSGACGRECLARRPKNYCKLATKSAATASCGGEAQIGLVARADSRLVEENAS